jgi:hypothetical protein
MSSTRAERDPGCRVVARVAVSSSRSIDYPPNSSLHEAFDSGADADVARCEDVCSEAAAVNQFAQHASWVSRSKWAQGSQSRRPTHSTSPTMKRCPTRLFRSMPRVTSSLYVPEPVAVGQGEFVEHFGLDQRQVVAGAALRG